MKKIVCTALSFLMCIALALTGCSAPVQNETALKSGASEIKLTIDDPEMSADRTKTPVDENGTCPVIVKNGRTLLPVRAVVTEMGGDVSWDDPTKTVTLTKDDTSGQPDKTPVTPDNNAEQSPSDNSETQTGTKSLVAYFSVTGNTKAFAEKIAALSGSDIFEIVPETPYTSDDINYSNDNCRANTEQHDDNARPKILEKIENFENYDVIFLGYPIWWGTMPKIINTFTESYDFSGKTVIPFCTSGGSAYRHLFRLSFLLCPTQRSERDCAVRPRHRIRSSPTGLRKTALKKATTRQKIRKFCSRGTTEVQKYRFTII